jgi:hypothetical protein
MIMWSLETRLRCCRSSPKSIWAVRTVERVGGRHGGSNVSKVSIKARHPSQSSAIRSGTHMPATVAIYRSQNGRNMVLMMS